MSRRNGKGGASALPIPGSNQTATPALSDQWEADAFASIKDVGTPTAAEQLIGRIKVAADLVAMQKLGADFERRWRVVKLVAERRYGQLLPPPAPGRKEKGETGPFLSEAEKKRARAARSIWKVKEPVFREYIGNPKVTAPSRAGLLNFAKPKAAGAKRPKRKRNWNGKSNAARLQELKGAGSEYGALLKFAIRVTQLCRTLEATDIRNYDLDDLATLDVVSAVHDDLISLDIWLNQTTKAIQAHLTDADVRKKIEQLRNTTGRTDAEVQSFLATADRLERKLETHLIAG